MAESTPASRSARPLLGWLSVGIAAAVFALVVGAIAPGLFEVRSSGSGLGAIAGGVRSWLVCTLVTMLVAGVASAVVGIIRGERSRWVHFAGVSLNVIAPIAAVLTIRLLLTAVL